MTLLRDELTKIASPHRRITEITLVLHTNTTAGTYRAHVVGSHSVAVALPTGNTCLLPRPHRLDPSCRTMGGTAEEIRAVGCDRGHVSPVGMFAVLFLHFLLQKGLLLLFYGVTVPIKPKTLPPVPRQR